MLQHSRSGCDSKLDLQRFSALDGWGAFIPAFILFCIGAVSNINVPGIYMDAVNPDYMVVRLLNPGSDVPAWVLPGNLLFGLFPVLGQIYHGALPFYIGLPVYALFGTGLIGVRLANLLFGLIVLVAAAIFLRSFRVRPAFAGLSLAALALDPGFLFSFRTQFYITLLPCAPMLGSIALVERGQLDPTPRIAALAGFFAGLAVYGYFIYGFLVPVAALHALWRWRSAENPWRLPLGWVAGLALGSALYGLGMLLILLSTGGVHSFLSFLTSDLAALGVTASPLALPERADYFIKMVLWTLNDVGPSSMMLQLKLPLSLPTTKAVLLLAVPGLTLMISLIRAPRSAGLVVIAGLVGGLAALVATFGNRLWLHHTALLLPVLYIALALALDNLVNRLGSWRASKVLAFAAFVPLIAGNVIDRQAMLFELTRTGGVGLASNAIENFAEDSLRDRAPVRAVFPDWGIFMPFEMVTHGRIPLSTDFTPQNARATLCRGQDILLATMDSQQPDRIPGWIHDVDWGQPEVSHYRQRDGVPVLTAIRWRASAPFRAGCAPS